MSKVNSLFQDEQIEQFNEVLDSVLVRVSLQALRCARDSHQTVGEKNDFYITLAQLEAILLKEKS
jgi:hypothetical protein